MRLSRDLPQELPKDKGVQAMYRLVKVRNKYNCEYIHDYTLYEPKPRCTSVKQWFIVRHGRVVYQGSVNDKTLLHRIWSKIDQLHNGIK